MLSLGLAPSSTTLIWKTGISEYDGISDYDGLTVISEDAEVRMGRNDNECGAIGVMSVAGTSGETMQPPTEMLYAVEPEGDATIRPSPWAVVTSSPSTNT